MLKRPRQNLKSRKMKANQRISRGNFHLTRQIPIVLTKKFLKTFLRRRQILMK